MSDEVVATLDRASEQINAWMQQGQGPAQEPAAEQPAEQQVEEQPAEEFVEEENADDLFDEVTGQGDEDDLEVEEQGHQLELGFEMNDVEDKDAVLFTVNGKEINKTEFNRLNAAARREGPFRNKINNFEKNMEQIQGQLSTWNNYVGEMEKVMGVLIDAIPVKQFTASEIAELQANGWTDEQFRQADEDNATNLALRKEIIEKMQTLKNQKPEERLTVAHAEKAAAHATNAALRLGADNDDYYDLAVREDAEASLTELGNFLIQRGVSKQQLLGVFGRVTPTELSIYFDAMKWNKSKGTNRKGGVREAPRKAPVQKSRNWSAMTFEQRQKYADKAGYKDQQRRSFVNGNWDPSKGSFADYWNHMSSAHRR